MSTTSQPINIVGLDFLTIKTNIQQYLQNQSVFSDYNFNGAALNQLLDILALNTNYLGWYLTSVASEMFLDSATQRNSLVSLAKQLNYVPYSRHSSSAVVNLVFTPTSGSPPAFLNLPKFYQFTTVIDGTNFTFLTNQAYTIPLDLTSNKYILNNVQIQEGTGFSLQFLVNPTQPPYQLFTIPNSNIDTSTLLVRVQNSLTDTTINVFTLAEDVDLIDNTSLVYFIQEGLDQNYQIYFGDGVLGSAINNNNVILVDYIACNSDSPDGASSFVASQQLSGIQNIKTTTVIAAYGGSERESSDSIRFSAPKNFQAQNRCITVDDYKTLLVKNYPNIQALSVWGGEDNVPPMYGQVFLSLKPVDGFVITDSAKSQIADILSGLNVLTVEPTIVDPDYIYLQVNTTVKYTPNLTTLTSNQIMGLVLNTIETFNINQINTFDQTFRFSQFTSLIDATEQSITNNLTNIRIQKRFTPLINTSQNVTLYFSSQNSLIPGTIQSSQFVVSNDPSYLQPYHTGDLFQFIDNGLGILQVYKQVGVNKVIVNPNAGTVDYINGIISIKNFIPSGLPTGLTQIKVSAQPVNNDVVPLRNLIVTIDPFDVTINTVVNIRNLS